jgi:uncharacterized protein YjdB
MKKANRRIGFLTHSRLASAPLIGAFLVRPLLILAIPILLGGFLQACGGSSGGPAPSTVQSVTIDPVNSSVAHGTQIQLHAIANFKNKTTRDITTSATWVSGNSTIANVSNSQPTKGLSAGAAVGATTVSARFQGKTGTSPFTVTNATLISITVVPVNPVIAKGTTVQLAAQGTFSNGIVQDLTNQVTWSSGNSGIATVSTAAGTLGLVTGVGVGNTPITATLTGIAGSTTVTVSAATVSSITITPPVATIASGTTLQLRAACNLSDGTSQDCTNNATWSSNNSSIAAVNSGGILGLVKGGNLGSATISASFNGMQGTAAITVTKATLVAITVLPDVSIAVGTTVQLTASGEFSDETTQDLTTQVSWTSDNEPVAQVSNTAPQQGLVTGLGQGSALITATLNGIHGSTNVTVTAATVASISITPPVATIGRGATIDLQATCNLSDKTKLPCTDDVSWSSANNTIAEVSDTPPTKGRVTGVGVATGAILATLNGVQGSATITVTDATLTSIAVTPPISTIAKGTTVQLTATCNYSDLSTQDCTNEVGWVSNNIASAQVSSQGLVTAIAVASSATTITATADNSGSPVSGSATVTVTAAALKSIAVVPANPSIPAGLTEQMAAIGFFSDGSTQDLTTQVDWTSDTPTVALVSSLFPNQGLVSTGQKGQTTGTAAIEATFVSGSTAVSGSTTATVTPATLTSIVVAPMDSSFAPTITSIPKGATVQLTAKCIFSSGPPKDCTQEPSLTWSSNNNPVASLSNLPPNPIAGLVTGQSVGGALITATLNGVAGSITVSVTPATLVKINVVPFKAIVSPITIAKGTTVQLIASGVYSDNTTVDLTSQVNWTSDNEPDAQVDPFGLVTGLNPGTATITATALPPLGAVSGTNMVTVTPAVLTSIAITPANLSIPNGATQILTATGTFSDGSTQNLTSSVSWVVSGASGSLGTVDQTTGLFTATTVGTGTITATLPSAPGVAPGTTPITVTAVNLTSIIVAPATATIPIGSAAQLSAICNYNAGPPHDCTTEVSWASADKTIAIVDSTGSLTPGLAHGVAAGTVTVAATLLNGSGTPISGMATVTVTNVAVTAIIVTPADQSFPEGTNNIPYTATAVFSDGFTQDVTAIAKWTSSDDSIAQVKTNQGKSNGEVSAKKVGGPVTITATVPSLGNASGSTTITVTQ